MFFFLRGASPSSLTAVGGLDFCCAPRDFLASGSDFCDAGFLLLLLLGVCERVAEEMDSGLRFLCAEDGTALSLGIGVCTRLRG